MKTAYRTAIAVATMAVAAQAGAQVTFYEREGFQGESFTTRRQIADFGRFGFNDRASSVIVAGDSWDRWQVCEDVRFGGTCAVLQPGQYPTLRAMGLNNRISSVQAAVRAEAPAPQAGRVVFYEKEGLSGHSFTTQSEVADFSRNGFNDRVSSVEVFGGTWEVCRDVGFAGPCVVLRAGQYPSLAAIGLNNSISSVRAAGRDSAPPPVAAARVIFHEKENFSGRSFTTQGDVVDFSGTGFNDRASSVEVFGGWFEACPDTGFGGACVLLRPGKYPSLASMGLNNRISSVRATQRDGRAQNYQVIPSSPVASYDPRRRGNEPLYEADVVAVRAVVGPPEQRCWVEREQVVQEQGRSSNVPGAVIGAVIGGILGHQVGDGRGRDLATVGGVIGGGVIGASVGRDGRPQAQTQEVQRCASTSGPVRAELWDVTYNFRGQEHRVQMTSPPGQKIIVNWDGEPRV